MTTLNDQRRLNEDDLIRSAKRAKDQFEALWLTALAGVEVLQRLTDTLEEYLEFDRLCEAEAKCTELKDLEPSNGTQ